MSKKVFFITIFSFFVSLNVTLVMIFYLLSGIFDVDSLKTTLSIVSIFVSIVCIYAAYTFVYFVWKKEVEHNFEVKEKYKKELIEAVKATIDKKINDNIIYKMDKDNIDSILKEIRREENNIVFLRTLADAICSKDGKWDCKSIEKLLTAMNSINNCENKGTHAH